MLFILLLYSHYTWNKHQIHQTTKLNRNKSLVNVWSKHITVLPQEMMATCAYLQHVTGWPFLQAWQHGPSQIHQHFRTLEASPNLSDLPAHQTWRTHEWQKKHKSSTSHSSLGWFTVREYLQETMVCFMEWKGVLWIYPSTNPLNSPSYSGSYAYVHF